jgi:hypothetical protein
MSHSRTQLAAASSAPPAQASDRRPGSRSARTVTTAPPTVRYTAAQVASCPSGASSTPAPASRAAETAAPASSPVRGRLDVVQLQTPAPYDASSTSPPSTATPTRAAHSGPAPPTEVHDQAAPASVAASAAPAPQERTSRRLRTTAVAVKAAAALRTTALSPSACSATTTAVATNSAPAANGAERSSAPPDRSTSHQAVNPAATTRSSPSTSHSGTG